MKHYIFREDYMITKLIAHFNLHWNDEESYAFLEDVNGKVFSANDYKIQEVFPILKLKFKSGEEMFCDAILFFGDCTIEFHDMEEKDAYNWDDFEEESLCLIEEFLEKIVKK